MHIGLESIPQITCWEGRGCLLCGWFIHWKGPSSCGFFWREEWKHDAWTKVEKWGWDGEGGFREKRGAQWCWELRAKENDSTGPKIRCRININYIRQSEPLNGDTLMPKSEVPGRKLSMRVQPCRRWACTWERWKKEASTTRGSSIWTGTRRGWWRWDLREDSSPWRICACERV